jgi:membrane protein DedA with SNARE-associated domain
MLDATVHGSLQELIDKFGYVVLFIGTFVEGETVLILGGAAARLGYLKLEWVIACAFAGSLLGDQVWFWVGRRYGTRLLARHASWRQRVARIHALVDRFEIPVLIGFRFLYGIRSLTPFVIGMGRISASKFMVLNALGALLWSASGAALGYALTHTADVLLGNIKRYELELLGVLAALGLSLLGYRKYRQRRKLQ